MSTGCAPIDTVVCPPMQPGAQSARPNALLHADSVCCRTLHDNRAALHTGHHEQRDTQQGPVQLTRQPAHAPTAITPERLRRLPFEWSTE